MLTPKQKNQIMTLAEILTLMRAHPVGFMALIVTHEDMWVPCFDPETKDGSKQWRRPSSPTSRYFKVTKSSWKVVVTVFWDPEEDPPRRLLGLWILDHPTLI